LAEKAAKPNALNYQVNNTAMATKKDWGAAVKGEQQLETSQQNQR